MGRRKGLWIGLLAMPACLLLLLSSCMKPQSVSAFDSHSAFSSLKKQVAFGPRVPGTQGHADCKEYLAQELAKHSDKVLIQSFKQNVQGQILPLHNIIAWINPEAKEQVLLAAHWDTRPIADQEVLPEKRNIPIPGANDGASGVSVLLELARVFHEKRPEAGVIIVLFDGEDYGRSDAGMYLGAKYFAKKMETTLGKLPDSAILIDMIGDSDLNIYQEANSAKHNRALVDKIWGIAKKLGYEKNFVNRVKYSITDDHIPLINAGLPCIDIIDFDYAYWHTGQDTPDKCSPESLGIVGNVLSSYVYSLK